MKHFLKNALFFAIYGLACGVFFREFTKYVGDAPSNEYPLLGMVHPHVLLLGMGGYLIVSLFVKILDVQQCKLMTVADICYFAGLVVSSITMLIRGVYEVVNPTFFDGNASMSSGIAGIAGLGHMATGVGIIMFFVVLIMNSGEKKED